MKSTKNIFITGVALAIALFASVQVMAMEQKSRKKASRNIAVGLVYRDANPTSTINPYLSDEHKEILKTAILYAEQSKDLIHQELNKGTIKGSAWTKKVESEEQRIKRLREIYYGNKVYTADDVLNTIYS